MMFDAGSDDVIASADQSEDRQVIAFRPSTGEHNLRRAASEKRSHRLSRALNRCPRFLSMMVNGRRIPEVFGKVRLHGLENLRKNGRCRVVVEVNPAHGSSVNCTRIRVSAGGARLQPCRRLKKLRRGFNAEVTAARSAHSAAGNAAPGSL